MFDFGVKQNHRALRMGKFGDSEVMESKKIMKIHVHSP